MTKISTAEARKKARAKKFLKDAEVPGSFKEVRGRYYWNVTLPGSTGRKSVTLRDSTGKAPTDILVAANLAVEQWSNLGQLGALQDFDGSLRSVFDHWNHLQEKNEEDKRDGLRSSARSVRKSIRKGLEPYLEMPINNFNRGMFNEVINKWRKHYVVAQARMRVRLVMKIFNHAIDYKMALPSVAHEIITADNVKVTDSGAKQNDLIYAADPESVKIVKNYSSQLLSDMMDIHVFIGVRPEELVMMRPCDIDTDDTPWMYHSVQANKNAWRKGKKYKREVAIGERAQALLLPYLLKTKRTDYLFNPTEAIKQRHQRQAEERKTPLYKGTRPDDRKADEPQREPGQKYTPRSYAKAVKRACERAKAAGEQIVSFTPNQLRHLFGTKITRLHGIKIAADAMGHQDTAVTERYVHEAIKEEKYRNMKKAVKDVG